MSFPSSSPRIGSYLDFLRNLNRDIALKELVKESSHIPDGHGVVPPFQWQQELHETRPPRLGVVRELPDGAAVPRGDEDDVDGGRLPLGCHGLGRNVCEALQVFLKEKGRGSKMRSFSPCPIITILINAISLIS